MNQVVQRETALKNIPQAPSREEPKNWRDVTFSNDQDQRPIPAQPRSNSETSLNAFRTQETRASTV